jgi:transposase
MQRSDHRVRLRPAVQAYDTSLFVALELSKSTWLVAVSIPGSDRASKYRVEAADTAGLLDLLGRLRSQAVRHSAGPVKIVSIHEAGLDGFWVHRVLEANGWRVTWSMLRRSQ